MKFVIDASFVASLFLPHEASEACDKLANRIAREGATAPGLLQLEVTNILLMAERRKRISGRQLKQLSEAFDRLPVTLQPALTADQRRDVQRLAEKHTLSAYDAAYLELAMRLGLPLASLDESLSEAAADEGVNLAVTIK
ncbi:MAG: type II toxin-antitoxin system VapC family toxin [Tepidisphaeraceae bacterium]|jgi:predicted nucleic acid-binding protein